jgi:hypothetical protein
MKLKVSSEWTCAERLAVIGAILEFHRAHNGVVPARGLQQIHYLVSWPPEFLEKNRREFIGYINTRRGAR